MSEQNYGPEEEVDLSKVYKGIGGQGLKWKRAKCKTDGTLDLFSYFVFDMRIAYAAAFVYSRQEQKAAINVSTDGGSEAWMNGEKLFSVNRSHGFGIDGSIETVKTKLKKGRNVLLLKSSHYWDDWKLRVSIEAQHEVKQSYK